MPKIFELFGYPLSVHNPDTQRCRQQACCPFTGQECDGGGNRYASYIDISSDSPLRKYFGNRDRVAAGVCSIQTSEKEAPWIVCPRRLFAFRHDSINFGKQSIEDRALKLLGYSPGTKLGIWSELKLKFVEMLEDQEKIFDYTFDFIVAPLQDITKEELTLMLGDGWNIWRRVIERSGYTIRHRECTDVIEDCPAGIPGIIEVMTASTSGGNKTKRTTITQAFQDAILGKEHNAPGINKRQIWARMVGQLIAKSEIALGWGGKALWIVQDALIEYISLSTALNIQKFISRNTDEVNLLSITYGNQYTHSTGIIELQASEFYAGPISVGIQNGQSFQDIIRAPMRPPLKHLLRRLVESKPVRTVVVS